MGERSFNKHKVALDALASIEEYASALNIETYRNVEAYAKAEDLLGQVSLPSEVKERVKGVAHTILRNNIATIRLLEEENKREVELLEKESKRKNERIWRRIWKGVILILYVLVMFGAYRKENWTLIFLCVPISFVEKLLLNDTLALRLWARILTRTKDKRR